MDEYPGEPTESNLINLQYRNQYMFRRWIEGDTYKQLSEESYPKVSLQRARQIITKMLQEKGIAPIRIQYGEGQLRGILSDYLLKLPNKGRK